MARQHLRRDDMTTSAAADLSPLGTRRSWNATVAILAIASSVFVSVGYLPQPMLGMIGHTFDVGPDAAGWVATCAQLGTACGILLLVPMSDIVRPRVQIEIQTVLASLALFGAALAPHLIVLCLAVFAANFLANLAQVVMPLALRTAPDGTHAKTTGTLAGSLLFGIFGGRIVAGTIAEHYGWRAVFVTAAVLVLLMAPLVRVALHSSVTAPLNTTYPSLLRSLPAIARANPGLTGSAWTQFFTFAAFNGLWTVIALYLTGDDVGWSAAQAGYLGVVGLLAGFITLFTGQLIAKVGATTVVIGAIVLVIAATVVIMLGSSILVLVIAAMFILTIGNQAAMVANQSRALTGMKDAAGRANTIYMVGAFLGGAMGASVGALAYSYGGLSATAACATVAGLLACATTGMTVYRLRSTSAHKGAFEPT